MQKKMGNNHSDLLDSLLKSAEQVQRKEEPRHIAFAEKLFGVLKEAQDKPSLKEVIAGAMLKTSMNSRIVANGRRRTAQFNDPGLEDPAMPPGGSDAGAPGGFDAGLGGELSDSGAEGELGGAGDEKEKASKSVAQALIDLCGGPEEAKACIDAAGGLGGEAETGDDLGMGAPTDDLGGGGDTAEALDDLGGGGESAEMPAPMPMSGGMM
jgi:hypothetical protein